MPVLMRWPGLNYRATSFENRLRYLHGIEREVMPTTRPLSGFESIEDPRLTRVAGDIIPIDGKRWRGAFRASQENVIHQVRAWSCRHQLVLVPVKTAAQSNEITAIPELLQ